MAALVHLSQSLAPLALLLQGLENGLLLKRSVKMSYSELPVSTGSDLLSLQSDMAKVESLLAPASPADRVTLLDRLSANLFEENIEADRAEIRLMDSVEALEDLPASLMDLARKRAMKNRRYMPKPVELIGEVRPEIDALLDAKHQLGRLIDRAKA
jgi:hypothetical protein